MIVNAEIRVDVPRFVARSHRPQVARAVRCDTNLPSAADLQVKTTTGEPVSYRLLSLPLYMVESLPQLLAYAEHGRGD